MYTILLIACALTVLVCASSEDTEVRGEDNTVVAIIDAYIKASKGKS